MTRSLLDRKVDAPALMRRIYRRHPPIEVEAGPPRCPRCGEFWPCDSAAVAFMALCRHAVATGQALEL